MILRVNGETREVAEGMTVAGLLEFLKLPSGRLAVEVNEQVVRRAQLSSTILHANDVVEIVQMIGGG